MVGKKSQKKLENSLRWIKKTKTKQTTTYQNLWNAAKAVLRGKLTAVNAYIKQEEKSQISNLTLHLEKLEEKLNPKLAKGRK